MKQRTKLTNKGLSAWQLSQVALTLVFVGVALSVGIWVNQQTAETGFGTDAANHSQNFAVNATWYALPHRAQSISQYANYSNSTASGMGLNVFDNTTNNNAGFESREYGMLTHVRLHTNATMFVGTYNVTYRAYNSSAYYATANATEGLNQLNQWLPIIAIVIAAGIIIGALMMWFSRRY